ncbi:MAG: PAS domain S-box protein [Desulforhopalus sp.]|nr:PAS domain S-box protein [Desulforhopalus sp.]
MSITRRYISLILVASLLPILLVGVIGLFLMRNTASQMIDQGSQALLATEKEVVLQKARLSAMKISAFLKTYQDQVEAVRQSVSTGAGKTPLATPPALGKRYPADNALLPGYGYIHPEYGTYANWDMLAGKSSPLIRRAVVEKIRTDAAFRQRAIGLLEQIMPAAPLMEVFHSLHPDSIDLIWIVLTDGIDVTYPNDYAARLAAHPTFNELNEAQEDYVRLFDAEHNPQRKMQWMKPYRDAIKRAWMVSCVAPLYNGNTFIGTTGFDILLQSMTAQIQDLRLGDNGYALLLNGEGYPVALPAKAIDQFFGTTAIAASYQRLFTQTPGGTPQPEGEVAMIGDTCLPEMQGLAAAILGRASGVNVHPTASGPMVFASATVEETGWIMVTAMPLAEIKVPVARLLERSSEIFWEGGLWILALLAAVATTAALIGSYLGLKTTRPLHKLIADVDTIGRDGTWRQVSSGTDDEFQLLADSVNRMVATIQKSERNYRNIFNNVRETFFETSVDGMILDISPSVSTLSKGLYTREDLLGRPLKDFYAKAGDRAAFLERLMGEGNIADYEVQLKNRDGSIADCWLSARLLHNAEGRPSSIIGSLTDITERKKADLALRESEERFSKAFTLSPAPMVISDIETGRFIDANERWLRITGHTREETIGHTSYELGIWGNPEERARLGKRVKEQGSFHNEPICFRTKSGEIRDSLWSAETITLGGSAVMLSLVHDYTERKRAENALRDSESYNKVLFQDSHIPLAVLEPDTGRFIDCNQAAVRIYGFTHRDELLGKLPIDLSTPGQYDGDPSELAATRRIQEALDKGFAFFEWQHQRPNGEIWDTAVHLMPFIHRERVLIQLSLQDITGRKKAEAEGEKLQLQLIQSQKMDSIGRLAGGVAHDFNNMLSVILGHTQLAMLNMDAGQPLFARLKSIREAAERAADLTRQLLAFARKQTITLKVLDFNETVEGMLKMVQRLIGENITLSWLPGNKPGTIMMDPSQIDQILVNLCVNARDAIEGTGKIIIETGAITLDEAYCALHPGAVPGSYAQLVVSDTGCGMDAEELSHLFEPFYTTKDLGKGTGLGLATVYGIVKQNHGFINVYSEPGQGTTVRIYFPHCLEKATLVEGKDSGESAARGSETILLVEDGPTILDITKTMLEVQGYTVLAAATPDAAIRLAEEHAGAIDLLLTDVIMPQMNGRDLAEHLVTLYPAIKHMFMSGYTANVIAHQGVLNEDVHFIQKPFSMNNLAAGVRKALDAPARNRYNEPRLE